MVVDHVTEAVPRLVGSRQLTTLQLGDHLDVVDQPDGAAGATQVTGLDDAPLRRATVDTGIVEYRTADLIRAVVNRQGPCPRRAPCIALAGSDDIVQADLDAIHAVGQVRGLVGDRRCCRRVGRPRRGSARLAARGDVRDVGIGVVGGDGLDAGEHVGGIGVGGEAVDHRLHGGVQGGELFGAGGDEPGPAVAQLAGQGGLVVGGIDRGLHRLIGCLADPALLFVGETVEGGLAEAQHVHLGPQHDVGGDVAGLGGQPVLEVLGDVDLSATQVTGEDLVEPAAGPDADVDRFATQGGDRVGLYRRVVGTEPLRLASPRG